METQEILQRIHDWTNGKIVYDISVAHPDGQGNPTKYATLAAALGANGANIPEAMRKGGMSVKFVHSSDNKYVQVRCMAQNFTTDVAQWQGVDDEPTPNSHNLAESGGVLEKLSIGMVNDGIDITQDYFTAYITTEGVVTAISASSNMKVSQPFLLKAGHILKVGSDVANRGIIGKVDNGNPISIGTTVNIIQVTPSSGDYFSYSYKSTVDEWIVVSVHTTNYNFSVNHYGDNGIEAIKTMMRSLSYMQPDPSQDAVVWADGVHGRITAYHYNEDVLAYDSFTITHDSSGLQVRQPTITYNDDFEIVSQPELVIENIN